MEIKVPFYNILNVLLTGLIFGGGCVVIFPEYARATLNHEIIKSLGAGPEIIITVCAFAVAYEVGLIINRVGSIVIENFFKLTRWIPFNDDYVLFNKKKNQYPIMSTLSREYALSRTGIALFLALLILSLIALKWPLSIACVLVILIYFFSCRKYSAKIVTLMEEDDSSEN